MTIYALVVSALAMVGQGPTPSVKAAVIQSVLNHPKIQLHYYPSYLTGNKRVEIVCSDLPVGTKLKLFETTFRTKTTLDAKRRSTGNYILIESVKVKGDHAEVKGVFPAQGLVIEVNPVFQHQRWIPAWEKIGVS